MTSRFYALAALSIIGTLLLTYLVYRQGLAGPFVLDDTQNIIRLYVTEFNWSEIYYAVTHNTSGIMGRPVSVLSLVFSGIVHGPGTWGYKYHNLTIHLINGLLIFWMLIKLLPNLSIRELEKQTVILIAGLTAGMWLLHPLMVSTVLYAVQRMAQLSTLFILLALLSYIFARENINKHSCKFYCCAYLLFPLSLLMAMWSKENGALVPFYILLLELIAFRFEWDNEVAKRRLYTFLGIFVAIPLCGGTLYLLTHVEEFVDYSLRDFDIGERLLTQSQVIFFYLKMILLPRLADMGLFHDDFGVVRQLDLLTAFCILLLMTSVYLVFALRKRAPVLAFAIGWYLTSHLMESTFISLELVFEHRNYLAALGPLLALVYYLVTSYKKSVMKVIPVLLLITLSFMSFSRTQEWGNEQLLYQMAVRDHPNSFRARVQSANQSFRFGDINTALEHLAVARELKSNDIGPVLHEILYLCGRGQNFNEYFKVAGERAVRGPISVYAINGFDNLLNLYKRGLCPELSMESVISLVEKAKSQVQIKNSTLYTAFLEKVEGQAYILKGDYERGVESLKSSYEKTGQVIILIDLVAIQMEFGQLDDAEELLAEIEMINQESYGIESARLQPIRERLAILRDNNIQQNDINRPQE